MLKIAKNYKYLLLVLLFQGAHSSILNHVPMEESTEPKLGTAKVSSAVIPYLLTLGCSKRLGYPRNLNMRFVVWDTLKKIQKNEIHPDEFRKILRKLYSEDIKKTSMFTGTTGYLPEIEDVERDYSSLDELKALENPSYEAWDYILNLMDKKYSSDDRSLYNLAYWSDEINKVADHMQDWLVARAINPAQENLMLSLCQNLAQKGFEGEAYLKEIVAHKDNLKNPIATMDFLERNPEATSQRPYVPANVMYPLSAEAMAEKLLKSLWCENISDVYHEIVYSLQERHFTADEFLNAVQDKAPDLERYQLSSLESVGRYTRSSTYGDMYASERVVYEVERKTHGDEKADLFDVLSPLKKIYRYEDKMKIKAEERLMRTVDHADLVASLDESLSKWQQRHLKGLDKKNNFERKNCSKEPHRQTGQEFRNYVRNAVAAHKSGRSVRLQEDRSEFTHGGQGGVQEMEQNYHPPQGSAFASSVAQKFVDLISCTKVMNYRNDVSISNGIWDLVRLVQEKKLNPEEFRSYFKTIYKEDSRFNDNYLPKLYFSDRRASSTDDLEKLVGDENPIFPALDYIMELAQEPQRNINEISKAGLIVELWFRQRGIQKKGVLAGRCEKTFVNNPLLGHDYRMELRAGLESTLKPEASEDYSRRNPDPQRKNPYVPPHHFTAITASEAAKKFVNGLWCDNFRESIWELGYRISQGHFSYRDFEIETKKELKNLNSQKDYKIKDSDSLWTALEPLRELENQQQGKEKKWSHYVGDVSRLLSQEPRAVEWQRKNLRREDDAVLRRCKSRPSSQVGQELRAYLRDSYGNFRQELLAHYEKEAQEAQSKLDEESTRSNLSHETALKNLELATKQIHEAHDKDSRSIQEKFDTAKETTKKKYLADVAAEKQAKLARHHDQMFDLVDLPAEVYQSKYGADPFAGACHVKGNSWKNKDFVSRVYRAFAKDYSEEIRARSPQIEMEKSRLQKSGLKPLEVDKAMVEYRKKLLSKRRSALLKYYKTFFYVACAESSFDPLCATSFTEGGDHKRVRDFSLAGALEYKAHLLEEAAKGIRSSSIISNEANFGTGQISTDRWYVRQDNSPGFAAAFLRKRVLGLLSFTSDGSGSRQTLDREQSLKNIAEYCRSDRDFTQKGEAQKINEEILAAIHKGSEDDDFELMSLNEINTYAERKKIKPKQIAAMGYLVGICPQVSIDLHKMVVMDFPSKNSKAPDKNLKLESADDFKTAELSGLGDALAYYETLQTKSASPHCSEDGVSKTLCSEPLERLASQVEGLALPVGRDTMIYDNPLVGAPNLLLGRFYINKVQELEASRQESLLQRKKTRDEALRVVEKNANELRMSQIKMNDRYQQDKKKLDEKKESQRKSAERMGLGL